MAYPRLDIVDPANPSTVLYSFNDQTGAVNTGGVVTKLAAVRFGPNTEIEMFEHPAIPGGDVTWYRDAIWTSDASFYSFASSADVHATSLGTAARLLATGGTMIWQPLSGSPVRYIKYLPSPRFPYLRGQHVPDLSRSLDPITFEFLMQPGLWGDEVTTTGVTVPNDPATSTKARTYAVTVQGEIPTPARVRVQMDSGAAVEKIHVAHRGPLNSTDAADWLSDTAFFQCEATGRGWSIALSNDTAGATDSAASPGSGTSVARCTYSSDPTVMKRRVRATRTTKLNSIRGAFRLRLRCKASAAANHRIEARWGPSLADPPAYANKTVTFDTSVNGTPATFGYVELDLGRIYIPDDVSLGGLAIEIWSRRVSGSGNLDMDFVQLVPADEAGVIVVPIGDSETWLGDELITPTNPASSSGVVVGTDLNMNASGEAGGVPPVAGQLYAAGRHRVTFRWRQGNIGAPATVRIRNITDSANVVSDSVSVAPAGAERVDVLEFDIGTAPNTTSDLYQPQFENQGTGQLIVLHSITHEFLQPLLSGESARTEPGDRRGIDRLDSSGNLAGYLSSEGEIPAILPAGVNHLTFATLEMPLVLYEENDSVRTRTPTVTVAYFPRYPI